MLFPKLSTFRNFMSTEFYYKQRHVTECVLGGLSIPQTQKNEDFQINREAQGEKKNLYKSTNPTSPARVSWTQSYISLRAFNGIGAYLANTALLTCRLLHQRCVFVLRC